MARFSGNPECSKIARSPSSWGSSSQKQAIAMEMPWNVERENAAPMLRPSTLQEETMNKSKKSLSIKRRPRKLHFANTYQSINQSIHQSKVAVNGHSTVPNFPFFLAPWMPYNLWLKKQKKQRNISVLHLNEYKFKLRIITCCLRRE